jgi:hypothetical protein
VIQDFADPVQFPDGSTNIHVITMHVDDAFEADTVGNATNDQRGDIQAILS